jgi:superoxide dismutase, Cu-Zn family
MIPRIAAGRSRLFVVLAALGMAVAISAPLYALAGGDKPIKNAQATLLNSTGTAVGTVHLKQEGSVVKLTAKFDSLSSGFHGFHIHTIGICTPTAFTSAGGHLNPGGVGHGGHAGDMPVLLVNGDGTADTSFTTDRFTVDQLFDADGSAIVVHAGSDNYANIPTRYTAAGVPGPDAATLGTGDAGARFACGVVETDTD